MSGESSLAGLVRNQGREFEAISGIAVEVAVTGDERPAPPVTVAELFRIVQESLSNVMRHSGAESVRILLDFSPGELRLCIVDDGAGFDPEAVRRGHGLTNIVTRAETLGGRATFPVVERGCQVDITIPLAEPST
jgi:signal transduction histidine kinase